MCPQGERVQRISLDLSIGNQPRLQWMGQHHFLNAVNLLEQIVNAAPVPACFHYRFAWTFQARKKLSETSSLIAVNPAPPQLPASLIYCNKHTIALVDINSNIVHEQQSPFGLALPQPNTRPKLLSCYLTPAFLSPLTPNSFDFVTRLKLLVALRGGACCCWSSACCWLLPSWR